MIYFIQAEGVGHIKIGFTDKDDAIIRLAELQVGSPVKLVLLGTIPGTMQDETDLHRRFASAHVIGEWFKPVPELMDLIAPGSRLGCGKVAVQEYRVEVRCLTVNRRQLTRAFFWQMPSWDILLYGTLAKALATIVPPAPSEQIPEHWSLETDNFLRGLIWGRVHIPSQRNDEQDHLVWERQGVLYRQGLPERCPTIDHLEQMIAAQLTGLPAAEVGTHRHHKGEVAAQQRRAYKLADAFWDSFRGMVWKSHLFIGV